MKKDSEWNSRDTWKTLDRKGKIQFFKDYYLWPCVGIVVVAAVLINLIWHMLFPKPGAELYVAVYDITLDQTEVESLKEQMAAEIGNGVKPDQIVIDDTYRSGNINDEQRLQVFVANHSVDVIIADDERTAELAGFGYFADVNELLDADLVKSLDGNGKLLMNPGFDSEYEGISIDDNGNGRGEKLPYSVIIDDSKEWKALAGEFSSDYCDFSVVAGCDHPENAKRFLEKMILK